MKTVKVQIVKTVDRLPLIAAEEYGDPRLWRLIAEANNIDDPLRFPAATDLNRILTIPGR